MSKTKVIEVFERTQMIVQIGTDPIGRVVTTTHSVDELRTLNSDYINENFGELQDTAYQKGFEDGKAVNDKGCEGCKLQGTDSNICDQCRNSYANQWKENDEKIVVGDEVKWNDDLVVITRFCDDPQWLDGIDKDGTAYHILKSNARKTGRHFDIASILEDMRHD